MIKKGPFSGKFKKIPYHDINNIAIKQGKMQKRLKIGNLMISTGDIKSVLKGIKNPNKIKELINKEKTSEYERRTLLRKIL
ncbi:MAG: PH domain-containing protein [Candidatus Brocadia sp.]